MRKKVLIICDSHGADYGAVSYTTIIKNKLSKTYDVVVHSYAGLSIKKTLSLFSCVNINKEYDIVIIQLGNPDIHPRMPYKPLKFLREKGLTFMRDSLFSVPPTISVEYFLRLPFFMFRLFFTRLYKSYYSTIPELIEYYEEVVNTASNSTNNIFVLPLFKVMPYLYSSSQNKRADIINQHLRVHYNGKFIEDSNVLNPNFYKKFYNYDGFHFNQKYHNILAEYILNIIQTK